MFLLSVLQMIHKVFKRVICNFVKKLLRFSKAKTLQASGKTETDSHLETENYKLKQIC